MPKNVFHLSLLSLFYLFLSLPTLASDALPSATNLSIWLLNENANQNAISIHQNIKANGVEEIRWNKLKSNKIYLKTPTQRYSWLLIQLGNQSEQLQELVLEITNNSIPAISIYALDPEAPLTSLFNNIGLKSAFADRPINYRYPLLPVDVNPGQKRLLLLQIEHHHDLSFHLLVDSRQHLAQIKNQEYIFFGMIYGALLMIAMYNLFIYLSIHEKSHLYFVLFAGFTGLFITLYEGHLYQFIGINSVLPKNLVFAVSKAMMLISFMLFCLSFLDIARWSKWLYRITLGFGLTLGGFTFLLGIMPEPLVYSHFTLLIIVSMYVVAIAAGIFIWNKGSSSAGFFSLAIFLCTVGILLEFLARMQVLPLEHWNYSFAALGTTAMIFVFAFALADKMRVLHNEKLRTTMKLVKLTEEKAQNNLEIYRSRLNEVELEKKANEARIASQAKSEFFAAMSHEIRTPMNGVLGMSELLEDTELNEKQQHYVSSISKSAKALLSVINDLLDYSKIESGKMELDTKLFNLEKIIDDCISISALRASEAKLNFLGSVTPGTRLQFKGDAEKIRQVTLNLLANAFSYTKNGSIFLNVYETGKNTVNSAEIRVEVISRGTVLNDQEKQSLFHQIHEENRSNKHHSHELGLTVGRQLVSLMDGELEIETEEDSTIAWFTCRLLLPHKNEIQILPDRSKHLSGRRMLICDSNEAFVESIKSMTQYWGMEICSVSDPNDIPNILLEDKNAYQILMLAQESLSPAVQLAVRQSNVDHNYITSIILTTRSRTGLSKEEMKKRGIQAILEIPYTTSQLYNTLLKSMGVESISNEKVEDKAKLSILIAEDDKVNQMVVEGLLKKLSYKPAVVNNGIEALEHYKSHDHCDLILMDCEMPEMTGYDATAQIRLLEQGTDKHTIIIGLSGHSTPEYKEQALTSGMDDFIIKPVSSENIETILGQLRSGYFLRKKDAETDSE